MNSISTQVRNLAFSEASLHPRSKTTSIIPAYLIQQQKLYSMLSDMYQELFSLVLINVKMAVNVFVGKFIKSNTFTATDPSKSIPQSPFPVHCDVKNDIVSIRSSEATKTLQTVANKMKHL